MNSEIEPTRRTEADEEGYPERSFAAEERTRESEVRDEVPFHIPRD